MGKFLKRLFRIGFFAAAVACVAAGVFYFKRRENFLSFNDFVEELKDELSTMPVVALLF